jgi:hypothetical protein
MEAEDFARSSKAFAASSYAIDAEHPEMMRECLGKSLGSAPCTMWPSRRVVAVTAVDSSRGAQPDGPAHGFSLATIGAARRLA